MPVDSTSNSGVQSTQAYKSLIKSEDPKPLSDTRQYLHEGTADSSQPFGKAVNFVNGNLGSHGDDNISKGKAESYVRDVKLVEAGEISNSTGFANSAAGWLQEGNLTAAAMNFGGMMLAGAVDKQNMYKSNPGNG
ncbi:hypothetical protein ACFFU8_04370 [Chromobacterium piscinae]|uniref:hypothetical protein n=1 Tax=Chromobacterium piscinae TaxID=686831 RepID=UPI001C8C1A7B|nr:hypothetical protein [Chromobacterium piscinae]MBX9295517.1 hypothetical protein [Chromobacterium vaccinii]MBX9355825.1 hypothetical protein [Chromobacterium vaccinii]MCD4505102.1 hypothetical protein [Chromobacterium piscinae]MCD5326518.1 hypothetical protein [Chromobacterium piscinae]